MTETIETKTDESSDKSDIIRDLKYDIKQKIVKPLKYVIADRIVKKIDYVLADKFQTSLIMRRRKRELMKKIFLEYWAKSMGVVSATCEKVEIHRDTFYNWMKEDPVFAKKINDLTGQKNTIAEDLLWGKVTIKKDGACIRYYLDRKHPGYKPKVVNEVVAGDITLEDLIDKDEDELNKNNDKNKKDKSVADGKPPVDKKQEGSKSEVQIKHGTGVVLEKEDAPKSDTESKTKGIE